MPSGPTRVDQNLLGPPTSSGRIDDLLSFWAQWLSATFWNSRKVGGLKFAVLPDPRTRFFQDEPQRLFLLPDEAECLWGPPELIRTRWGHRQAQAGSMIC